MTLAISNAAAVQPSVTKPELFCFGVTLGFLARPGSLASAAGRARVDQIVELGVPWVVLTPTIMQESAGSPRMFLDFEQTPSDLEVAEIIDYMHERGLKVQLRAMIECHDGHGRNQIWFPRDEDARIPPRRSDYYTRWFASMRARTRHYATIAQKTGCEMYGLDSEIDRFVDLTPRWREVVDVARTCFSGPITSCHTHAVAFEKELANEDHWFRDLDVLGTSAYFRTRLEPTTEPMTVEQRIANLQPQLEQYRRMAASLDRPIMFGECGCTAVVGAGYKPWGWSGGAAYDGQEQADHLEAIIRVFTDEPWWAGLLWWKWDEHTDRPQFRDDPRGDKGFTIDGKPAASVLARYARSLRA